MDEARFGAQEKGKKGKKPRFWKVGLLFVLLGLATWAGIRWSATNNAAQQPMTTGMPERAGETLFQGASSTSVSSGQQGETAGNGALSQRDIAPSAQRTPGDWLLDRPFATSDTRENTPRPAPAEKKGQPTDGDRRAREKQETLPTEAATAAPATRDADRRAQAARGNEAVLPPPVAPGYLEKNEDIVPPAFLDVGTTLPPAKEDRFVLPSFIASLAHLLAQSYYPQGSHPRAGKNGVSVLTLQKLDTYYGQGLSGFNVPKNDPARARRSIFAYVMHPSMVTGLYNLYAGRFTEELNKQGAELVRDVQGKRRRLTPLERGDMFRLYARDLKALSSTLALSCEPEMKKWIASYNEAEKNAVRTGNAYAEAVTACESAKMANLPDEAFLKARDEAGAAYQNASRARNAARQNMIAHARKEMGSGAFEEEEMVYALLWGQRRQNEGASGADCVIAMSQVLDNLSGRFNAQAKALR